MRRAKRVKFVNTETDGIPVHASLRGHEATHESPRSGAPKTAEYAYFRKVKNGAVRGHSRSRHREEDEQLKSSKINYLTRETISTVDMPKPGFEDFRFSVSGERAGPSDHHLLLSPCVSNYDKPEQMRSKALSNKIKERSSWRLDNVTPVGKSLSTTPLNEAVQNSENQHFEKGIFSAKRNRLRQWAAHSLFSEAEKLHPKGVDLVSALLSRLLPKGHENNDSTKEDTDNSRKSHEYENMDKGSRKRDWEKNLLKICSGISSEIALSEWDNYVSGFPFLNYGTESHAQDDPIYLDQRSQNHLGRSFPTQHDFSFFLPLERYRSPGSFHFKELDEFGSTNDRAREAPNRLMLEWGYERGKDRIESSIINHETSKNVYPRSGNSWNVDQQRIMDDVLDSRGVRSSSLSSNYYLEFDSPLNYGSTSFSTHDFGPYFDDKKYAMAEPRNFSLALPYTSAEDRNTQNIHYDSNIIFSYSDQLNNEFWDSKPQTDFRWKFVSAADDPPFNFHEWQSPKERLHTFSSIEEDPGEPYAPFFKGTFNNNFFSSNFQSSTDTFINCPLLLNHVSHDSSKQEYFDDDDDHNELNYT